MHDFYYFLYLGRLLIHLNIIIQVSQHSSIFFLNLSTTMLTSAFKQDTRDNDVEMIVLQWWYDNSDGSGNTCNNPICAQYKSSICQAIISTSLQPQSIILLISCDCPARSALCKFGSKGENKSPLPFLDLYQLTKKAHKSVIICVLYKHVRELKVLGKSVGG